MVKGAEGNAFFIGVGEEGALFAVPDEAALGGQDNLVSPAGDGTADNPFGMAVAVGGGGVDEVDPLVEGGVDGGGGFFIVGGAHIQPPMAQAPRPMAETWITKPPNSLKIMVALL